MSEVLVSKEQATKEVNGWLDYKKVSVSKRESSKEQISALVDAVCEGYLSIKEDKTIEQSLKFPTEGAAPISKIQYQPRIKVSSINQHLQGVKATDIDARMLAYVAALTNVTKGVLGSFDTEDYGIAQSIAIFFM
jgi:Asp-tRNA(Asn)/Glu-tRNA(Gln) amidotransferase B subunit